MGDSILSALRALDVSELSRADWIAVGMALKEEGYTCDVWDEWSRNDVRYKPGECERKWKGFNGAGNPIKGGTIVQMAKDRGWKRYDGDGCLGWDDAIEYDGGEDPEDWDPSAELIIYLETLFEPSEIVGYVTGDVYETDGRSVPGKGVYDRTAGELITLLKKHKGDVGAVVGDWRAEVGAWIRFNPLDGEGVKNENVVRFRYALVESDDIPVSEQEALFRKLELPIACFVHSGGKSLHAIVKVDARDYDEYRKRVDFLYSFLDDHGVSIDKQNRNPSRLSRMPGVTRNGNRQRLIATNIGRSSWVDWLDYVEGISDELPGIVSLSEYAEPPELPEELIAGILRQGHKMLISGSSKAGKSFLLMELCVAIAEGRPWLGFGCKQGRVLYVNLEIDPASAINRFIKIYEALQIPRTCAENVDVWNLRGCAEPLDKLAPRLIRRMNERKYSAVVLDPIYKVITGDENSASEMGAFCNQLDKIASETGCSVIFCHHHSKGAQGAKRAIDRASGSGVFARDPDAQLDMIELELTDDLRNNVQDSGATAWRLESSLREFPNIRPLNFWFEFPIHRVDTSGELDAAYAEGSPMANLAKSGKRTNINDRRASLDTAYDALDMGDDFITVKTLAEYVGVSERCMRDRLKEFSDLYKIDGGHVKRI